MIKSLFLVTVFSLYSWPPERGTWTKQFYPRHHPQQQQQQQQDVMMNCQRPLMILDRAMIAGTRLIVTGDCKNNDSTVLSQLDYKLQNVYCLDDEGLSLISAVDEFNQSNLHTVTGTISFYNHFSHTIEILDSDLYRLTIDIINTKDSCFVKVETIDLTESHLSPRDRSFQISLLNLVVAYIILLMVWIVTDEGATRQSMFYFNILVTAIVIGIIKTVSEYYMYCVLAETGEPDLFLMLVVSITSFCFHTIVIFVSLVLFGGYWITPAPAAAEPQRMKLKISTCSLLYYIILSLSVAGYKSVIQIFIIFNDFEMVYTQFTHNRFIYDLFNALLTITQAVLCLRTFLKFRSLKRKLMNIPVVFTSVVCLLLFVVDIAFIYGADFNVNQSDCMSRRPDEMWFLAARYALIQFTLLAVSVLLYRVLNFKQDDSDDMIA
ncbi:uncharacterized protein LOC141914602 [Tubulanus polymorphus]|uniref:uncharacterized protein LOC141914602 n=1 Tax=Tubulanus polymorphus TaxID=672921 RepID=UPI003DA555FE